MRSICILALVSFVASIASAEDKKTTIPLAGLKGIAPADWVEEKPSNEMRQAQFKLPKAAGDKEDAQFALFYFPMGSGTVDANLKRQEVKFEIPEGVKPADAIKVTKTKVGTIDATYQDIKGTFLSKFPPFAPNAKITKKEGYRQLYVIFEAKDGGQFYITILGPDKTIEKHKKAFDEMLKNAK